MTNYFNPYQNFYQPAQQIQNGGFVSVRSEEEARTYPVAQGTSVTFKNETAPYIYTKTTGFSQLDQPIFEKFRLTKEDEEPQNNISIQDEIAALWGEINAIKEAKKTNSRRKDDGGD